MLIGTLKHSNAFVTDVYSVVAAVPEGKVVSYGQVAVMCGHPGAARTVGQIAHFGPPDLPWHRLVHSSGKMANGYVPGGPTEQMKKLIQEGVEFVGDRVNMKVCAW
jgi:methylated-DNA-protein-cysteine methyltransferase-like protein